MNKYKYVLSLILIVVSNYVVSAQCPMVEAIMVDACGTEQFNEFFIIHSGAAGFNTNDISVDYDLNNNIITSSNNDVNMDNGNLPGGPCGLTTGNIGAYTGCSNLIAIGPGYVVPPNSIVVFQTSSGSTNGLYNFSTLCGSGQCVYVISSSCTRSAGAFSNGPGVGTRTTVVNIGGCSQTITYTLNSLTGGNGAYYLPLSMTYGNSGCVVPPTSPATPQANVNQPPNTVLCANNPVSVTFTGTASTYTWTNSNASIGLGTSGTGNISFTAANVTTTQVGTITVTPGGSCPGPPKMFTITVNPASNPAFTFSGFCAGSPNGPTGIVTPGGTFSFNPNPGGGTTIDPSTGVISGAIGGTTYSVQYTTSGMCPATLIVMVQVTALQNASFTFNDYCQGMPNGPTGIVTPGGSFSFNPNPGGGVTINPSTGVITGGVGGNTYSVQYTTAGPCPNSTTVMVNVTAPVTPVLGPLSSPYCTSSSPSALPTTQSGINGNWSGAGVSGNQFTPSSAGAGFHTLTFTPLAGQCATANTIQVEVIVNPSGNLSGAPVLCPGQCGQVMFQFLGGSGTFSINMNISAGPFNINFPMAGVTNSTILTICLANGTPFDSGTNTLNIPTFVPTGTYSLTLVNFNSTPSGQCTNGVVGFPGTLSVTINAAPPAQSTSMTLCDLDQNGTEFFDLTTLNNTVKNNVFANTVSWFTDMAATNPITVPNSFAATNGTVVYAQVTSPAGCTNIVPVTLTLELPMMINTTNFSICINGPNYNLPGTVGGYVGSWSGPNVNNNQFNPTGLAAGSYQITFTPFAGQCALPATASVIITDAGPVPLNNPIATACLAMGQVTLNTQQNGVNGTWSGSSFLTGNIFNVSAAGVGSYSLTFTPMGAANCLTPNTTQIVVIANTTLNPVTFNNVCVGSPNVNLGNTVDGYPGVWSGNSQVNNNIFNPNTSAGIYNLVFTPNDVCVTTLTTTIEVTAPLQLMAPTFGTTCVNGSTISLPTSVDGIAGSWTYNNNPITNFVPSTYGQGSFNIVFTPNAGLCASPTTSTITINQISAGADASFLLCETTNQVINLNTLLSTGSTTGGSWTLLGSPVSNPTNYNLGILPVGTSVFSYLINDALCGRDTALISYVVAAENNAGMSTLQSLCISNAQSVNFNLLLGSIDSAGMWSQNMGNPINFSNLASVNLSSLGSGTFVFSYSIAADACPADTSTTSFTIVPFNSAGGDDVSTACLGSNVNLLNLINTAYTGGSFLNPNNNSGLTGNIWSTTGLSSGSYNFLYVATNQVPCLADTALFTINLAATVTAGNDQISNFCDGNVLNLGDYIAVNASAGGSFYQNNILVATNGYNPGNATNIVLSYIVGDGLTCPKDTAIITLSRIDKPAVSALAIPDICEGKCVDLTINHGTTAGSVAYLSLTSGSGQVYSFTHNITSSSPFTINTCAIKTGPFTFQKLPLNQTFTLKVDSIKVLNGGCRFSYNNAVNFKTIAFPARTITRSLCVGEVLQVGNDVYSVSKPAGVTFITSANASLCDSMITVNLTFNAASPPTNVNRTTCDQNFSLQVGSMTFNKANPTGQVTLKNKLGCDSLVNVSLIFSTFTTGQFNFITCDSAYTYTLSGQSFNVTKQTGNVTLTGASTSGCDSIVTINLKYLAKASSVLAFQTCDSTYQLTIGGTTFNKGKPNGKAILANQAVNGCDSIVNVNIAFLNIAKSNFTFSTCDDSYSYKVGSKTFNKLNPSGTSTLQNSAVNGCDSIVNVQLNYSEFSFLNNIVYACDGSDALLNISLASHPGPYQIKIDQAVAVTVPSLPFTSSLKPGAHIISIVSNQGCKDTIAVNVNNSSGPVVDLSQFPLTNGQFQLNVNVLPNAIFNLMWSPTNSLTCSDCLNPIANPSQTTEYTLNYLFGNNCPDSRTIIVEKVNSVVIIPNIFSPNGDGTNDKFFIQFPDKTNGVIKKFQIYDRWGNLIFNKQNIDPNIADNGWDGSYQGQELQPAVYVYFIQLQLAGEAEIKKYYGSISLIR